MPYGQTFTLSTILPINVTSVTGAPLHLLRTFFALTHSLQFR